MAGTDQRIIPNKGRELQVAPTRRRLFDAAAQQLFLDHFAETCNAVASAKAAGFSYGTVYRNRANNPAFAEKWLEALRHGYDRLEELALSHAIVALDWTPPEAPAPPQDSPLAKLDPAMALQLLREHKRGLAGIPKAGRPPDAATNAEVMTALVKRLKAFGVKIDRAGAAK